ncbi:glyoxalase superfamily protein [Sulfitobacter porphyrae]|uniref:Glyoxalase superfamily protein n=1 Tax=Sulfitobacter porphyrae TaxID=1246864 RepID=A0ABW2B2F2_9RHOB
MIPQVTRTAPVFRSFDEAKARAFYLDWLGFTWVGEHRFDADAPLYAFLRLGEFHLHLSEHHGDATPGSSVMVHVDNLRAWHASLPPMPTCVRGWIRCPGACRCRSGTPSATG